MDRLRDLLEQDQEKDLMASVGTSTTEYSEVEVYAFSIEEALKNAAEALKTSIVNLEYEIIERGQNGLFGLGKKPHKILVKYSPSSSTSDVNIPGFEDEMSMPVYEEHRDGSFKVVVKKDGIFLKVEPPKGKGRIISPQDIQNHLIGREILKYNDNAVRKEAENPSERFIKIGDYQPSPYDSRFTVQVSPDEMKAYATFSKPEKYGRVVEPDEVSSAIKAKNVHYGIKDKLIKEAIENELYNMPVIIAEGDQPTEGKDGQIKYHFKVDTGDIQFKEEDDGSVDFHKLDIVQSVVVGQVLATKVPPEKGKIGRTLSGRIIPARDGRDIKLAGGPNTHLSPDGMQVIADINGQVIFKNGKVQVEPVYEVSGDVDLSTGDINFPGNVIIYGNVNDTFKVYSGANIEIKGNVGKANVVAEGNIIVRQGIQGKDEAKIICAGDLYAKFIERTNVKTEGYVVVSEVILHSNIESKKKVLVQGGKRSQIAGGRVRALMEINAKFLGAEAYTETLLEVGIDPAAEDRISEIAKRKDEIAKEIGPINEQLSHLSLLLAKAPLPPEKEQQYNSMTQRNNDLKGELSALNDQLTQLQQYLDSLGKDSKVSASKIVYPGVKVKIKNEILVVKNDYKFVTFFREGGLIRISPYEKSKEMEEKLKGTSRRRG